MGKWTRRDQIIWSSTPYEESQNEAAVFISFHFFILCPKIVKGEKTTQTEHMGNQKWGRTERWYSIVWTDHFLDWENRLAISSQSQTSLNLHKLSSNMFLGKTADSMPDCCHPQRTFPFHPSSSFFSQSQFPPFSSASVSPSPIPQTVTFHLLRWEWQKLVTKTGGEGRCITEPDSSSFHFALMQVKEYLSHFSLWSRKRESSFHWGLGYA